MSTDNTTTKQDNTSMSCDLCHGTTFRKNGIISCSGKKTHGRIPVKENYQRYQCLSCGRNKKGELIQDTTKTH